VTLFFLNPRRISCFSKTAMIETIDYLVIHTGIVWWCATRSPDGAVVTVTQAYDAHCAFLLPRTYPTATIFADQFIYMKEKIVGIISSPCRSTMILSRDRPETQSGVCEHRDSRQSLSGLRRKHSYSEVQFKLLHSSNQACASASNLIFIFARTWRVFSSFAWT